MKLFILDEFKFSLMDPEKQSGHFSRKPTPIELTDVENWVDRQSNRGRLITCAVKNKDILELIKDSLNISMEVNPIDVRLNLCDLALIPEIENGEIIRWWYL